jgi:hypothetical protein
VGRHHGSSLAMRALPTLPATREINMDKHRESRLIVYSASIRVRTAEEIHADAAFPLMRSISKRASSAIQHLENILGKFLQIGR